jgi:hypothetical protein
MSQESQQHSITPEQISMCAYPGDGVASPEKVVAEINKLYAHVEALKASLLSLVSTVAKAGNDHKSRIEALELAQRVTDVYIVTAATLSPEERKELGVITLPEFKAAMARAARQGAENTMAQIRTGASKAPPLAGSLVEAPDKAEGLVEGVVREIADAALNADSYDPEGEARAAIRKVAAWLREQGGYPYEWTAQMLEKEADR